MGEDKGGLVGAKKDKYKVCSLLDKAHPKFWVQAAEDSQFCQALRYQNGSKGLVWHYINIDTMGIPKMKLDYQDIDLEFRSLGHESS